MADLKQARRNLRETVRKVGSKKRITRKDVTNVQNRRGAVEALGGAAVSAAKKKRTSRRA